MSDIAQILGVGASSSRSNKAAPLSVLPPPQPSRAMKMQSMSRDVTNILAGSKRSDANSVELPPIVPTFTRPSTTTASGAATAGNSTAPLVPGATPGIKLTGKDVTDKNAVVKVGNKWISKSKPARKWVWAPFASSSRTDGAMFEHWVRANVEYPDYPYARFDIHLDPVTYTSEEYKRLLQSDTWTKSETDFLMDLVRRFELRWAVILDRWIEVYGSSDQDALRNIEDLQHRYYSVAAKLMQSRLTQEAAVEVQTLVAQQTQAQSAASSPTAAAAAVGVNLPSPTAVDQAKTTSEALLMETAAARALASSQPDHQPLVTNLGTGTSNKTFDLEYERERRAHLEALWKRTKEEEYEEAELRRELKQVEAQLRKLKKSGRHILAAANATSVSAAVTGTAASRMSSAASSRNPSRNVSPVPGGVLTGDNNALDHAFASTAPVPMPQTPYLQSGRLAPPAPGGATGLNKTLITRMETFMDELKIPKRPLPTKRACDLFDVVRKDVLTLLILQKNTIQKEGLVQAKRLKLSKLMGGKSRVMDEDALLGIAPPPATATQVASAGVSSAATAPSAPVATGKTSKGKAGPKSKSAANSGGVTVKSGKGKTKTPKAAAVTTATSASAAPDLAGVAAGKPDDAGSSTKVTVKDAPARGKSGKKSTAKRKRNADTKPTPASSAASTAVAVSAGAASTTPAVAPAGTGGGKASAAAATAVTTVPSKADDGGKPSGKKRAKKS